MTSGTAAPTEPYTWHFMSAVDRIDGRAVSLEETYFYPEGGGQPADRGTLDGIEVLDVRTEDGVVVHELASTPSFVPGETISGSIEGSFRSYCMRAHTASHALYGAGRRLFEDLGYGGFGITPEKVRVDFATTTEIDDEALVELERLVNRVVWEDRSVTWETVPRSVALDRDDVAYNAKTAEGLTDEEAIRLVTIEDWDVAACGGTHVSSTGEIGPVSVLDRSNPGEGLTRVTFAVGPDAIDRRADDRLSALEAARELDCSVADLPAAARRLADQREAAQRERERLRDRYVAAQLEGMKPVSYEGQTWLVGAVDGLDANGLAEQVQDLAGERADVAVLLDSDGDALAVATGGDPPAEKVVESVTAAFGGGGGGSDTVAQAGGFDATVEQVREHLL